MIRKIVQVQRLDGRCEYGENAHTWPPGPPEESPAPADVGGGGPAGVPNDFESLLAVFNANQVEYLIVGGCALTFHGAPRAPGGIDLLVRRTPENAVRILAALDESGFASSSLRKADFTLPDNIVRLGVPPACCDIVTSLPGVSWDQVQAGKVSARYGQTPVFFLGRDDLITSMKALGREADAADLEALGTT